MNRAVPDYEKYLQYLDAHFENKDLHQRHRIPIENQRYYLLESYYGVSLVENKNFNPRYHPGGGCDGEGGYCLGL
ncbi:MAG: hypothetical protein IPN33_23045 [Saprospiraceae bacterium]|nr:hypothetical protein [Saprospiraceae bacterium]